MWAGIFADDLYNDHPKNTFPYTATDPTDPTNKRKIKVESRDHMWELIANLDAPDASKYKLAIVQGLAIPNNLIDRKCQDSIQRFLHSRDYSVPAFPGTYGDLPAWWPSACNIIGSNLQRAEKVLMDNQRKKEAPKKKK